MQFFLLFKREVTWMTVYSEWRKISQKKKKIHQNPAREERSRLGEQRRSLTHHTHNRATGWENNTQAPSGRKGRKGFSLNCALWLLNWALILIHLKEIRRMVTCVSICASPTRIWRSESELEFTTTPVQNSRKQGEIDDLFSPSTITTLQLLLTF